MQDCSVAPTGLKYFAVMEQGLHPCLKSIVPMGLILGFCAISYIIAFTIYHLPIHDRRGGKLFLTYLVYFLLQLAHGFKVLLVATEEAGNACRRAHLTEGVEG